jgi:hypothetical protein
MHLLQRAVPAPQTEIAVHGAARRQVLRDVAPLAAGAQHVHHTVDHFAQVHSAFAAAALGRRDQRLDVLSLSIGEITRVAQLVTVVATTVLGRPHRAPHEAAPPPNHSQSSRFKRYPTQPLTGSDDSICLRTDTQRAAPAHSASVIQRLICLLVETIDQLGQTADQVIAKAWSKALIDPQSDSATGSSEPPDLVTSGVRD